MKLRKLSFVLEIRTTSALHVTALGTGRYSPSQNKIIPYDTGAASSGTFPCALTRKMPVRRAISKGEILVPTAADEFADSAEAHDDGKAKKRSDVVHLPVIPANTIAGKLRNFASEIIERAWVDHGYTIKPQTYQTMRTGSPSTNMKRHEQTASFATLGANDPFFGLFGGTLYGIDSNLVVHEGWPVTVDTEFCLRRQPQVLPLIESANLCFAANVVRKDSMFEAAAGDDHSLALLGEANINEYIGMRLKENESKRPADGDGGKKTSLQTVAAIEAVQTGTGFMIALDLVARNDAQIGLLLQALREFMNDGQVGGKRNKGFGRFKLENSRMFETIDGVEQDLGPIFSDHGDRGGLAFSQDDVIARAVAAADTFIESVTPKVYSLFAADDAVKQTDAIKQAMTEKRRPAHVDGEAVE